MVRVALNLGYLYMSEKTHFEFDKNTFTVDYKEALMDKVNFLMKAAVS